jgi:hypothetical protein
MSVITLERKINSAETQSELFKKQTNWQEEVDSFLDRINELSGLLTDYHKLLLTLIFELERDSQGFKESKLAPEGLKRITTTTSKILAIVRKSDLFAGIKTIYYSVKTENNYIRELLHDRLISIELENDEEMKTIVTKTITSLNK